jgi:hypothetical protein
MSDIRTWNPTNRILRASPPLTYVWQPGEEKMIPRNHFRALFAVRCHNDACRERGYCARACPPDGENQGGVLGLAYEPIKEDA